MVYTLNRFLEDLLNTWVYAIAGRQRENLVIVDGEGHLDGIDCDQESNGAVQSGYACIWTPVPHVCFHRNKEVWRHERAGLPEGCVPWCQAAVLDIERESNPMRYRYS